MKAKPFLPVAALCAAAIALVLAEAPAAKASVLPPGPPAFSARVVDLMDGDSFKVVCEAGTVEVRLFDVNCPEFDERDGERAKSITRQTTLGRRVWVFPSGKRPKDAYGRLRPTAGPRLDAQGVAVGRPAPDGCRTTIRRSGQAVGGARREARSPGPLKAAGPGRRTVRQEGEIRSRERPPRLHHQDRLEVSPGRMSTPAARCDSDPPERGQSPRLGTVQPLPAAAVSAGVPQVSATEHQRPAFPA